MVEKCTKRKSGKFHCFLQILSCGLLFFFYFSAEQQQTSSSTSRMLITIPVIFLLSNVMLFFIAMGHRKSEQAFGGQDNLTYGLLDTLNLLPVALNSSANFPVLLLTMTPFRNNLKLAIKV